MGAVRAAGRVWAPGSSDVTPGVQLHEWEREGWTYHAKGSPLFVDTFSAYTHHLTAWLVSSSLHPVCVVPLTNMAEMNYQASGCVPLRLPPLS